MNGGSFCSIKMWWGILSWITLTDYRKPLFLPYLIPYTVKVLCPYNNAQSYFSKFSFSVLFSESLLLSYKFQNLGKMIKLFGCTKQFCDLQLPIFYCVGLIMVTITRHLFINISQMKHISAVKFDRGYEKNMSFLAIPKSTKVLKKLKK